MNLYWTFKVIRPSHQYELVLVDMSTLDPVYRPGYQSDSLLSILNAGWYLNGYWYHPVLTDRHKNILDGISADAVRLGYRWLS